MKQLLFGVLGLIASASLACAGEKIRMSTIAPGSSAYLVMTSFASWVNTGQDDFDIVVDATGAATRHMIDAAEGNVDLVMGAPNLIPLMRDQKAMFKTLTNGAALADKLQLVFWFPYGAYHVLTKEADGLLSLDDIKGKSVFLGPPGGGAFNTARDWIKATTGLEAGKDYRTVKAGWNDALQAFQDGRFEVYVNGGIPPYPVVEQLASDEPLRLLGLTRRQSKLPPGENTLFDQLIEQAGRKVDVVPAGSYGASVVNSEDVFTIGTTVGLLAGAHVSNEAVYQMTKTFWTRLPDLQRIDAFMKGVTPEVALSEMNAKLHPGALRYYKEAGWSIPSALQ